MRKALIIIAAFICSTFAINAQINDNYSYLAQSVNLQGNTFTASQVESMYALAGTSSDMEGYKQSSKWKVGKGLLIGGVSCLGLVALSYGYVWIAAGSGNWEDVFGSTLVFAWTSAFVGTTGLVLTIVGGAMMGAAKNQLAATIDLGTLRNPHTYAQLGLTPSGNLGLSLTF